MQTRVLSVLRRAMAAYELRTQALGENIANLETPGYQRRTVEFEALLQDERRRSHVSAETAVARSVEEDGPALLEDELMELADTQMRTQLSARALREHFALLQTGITGRSA
ncbi:MAG: flagellar biosynthesis protein FlgB [Rhodothermales bacterium]|nr:flagellar biosynthesis protein FlgB [Rhodothermales bacterium]